MRRRPLQHGVRHDHRRHPDLVEHGEDLVAVGAAVDAVLVLDDRDVEGVQGRGGALSGNA